MRLVTSGNEYLEKGHAMIKALANCFEDTPFNVTSEPSGLYIDSYSSDPKPAPLFSFVVDLDGGGKYLNLLFS